MIMIDLGKKIEEIKGLLMQSLGYLDELDSKNFDFNLNFAKNLMKNAHILKQQIKSEHKIEDLRIFEPDLTNIAKQISDKFDNILVEKRLEMKIIAKKLRMIQNQKKLLNYSR